MGERTSYAPGTFSWAELLTSDAEAAKGFYTGLFGWSYDDRPIPDDGVYSMAQRDGKNVAAMYSSAGQPPHWNCYVTVESADAAAKAAAKLGAEVMADAFDVMDAGRMAVFADPTGAVLSVWEPGTSIGAQVVNTPGSMTWNDLGTPDAEKAAAFYGDLFGWTTQEMPDSGGYRVIFNGGRSNGGIMPRTDAPPAWVPYFGHEDVDRLAGEVADLGGTALSDVLHLPQGSMLPIADPQGAVFAAWTGEYDPD
jgi:uncharacterized protein